MATRRERQLWTPEEDQKLYRVAIAMNDDHPSWTGIAALAGLERRIDKDCWERWNYYLKPDVNKANFSQEEDDNIIRLHRVYGNKWATIAANPLLRGRSPNAIKNRWNNHLKKRLEIMSELERHLLYLELHLLTDDDASDHFVSEDDLESSMTEFASVIPNVNPNASSTS